MSHTHWTYREQKSQASRRELQSQNHVFPGWKVKREVAFTPNISDSSYSTLALGAVMSLHVIETVIFSFKPHYPFLGFIQCGHVHSKKTKSFTSLYSRYSPIPGQRDLSGSYWVELPRKFLKRGEAAGMHFLAHHTLLLTSAWRSELMAKAPD